MVAKTTKIPGNNGEDWSVDHGHMTIMQCPLEYNWLKRNYINFTFHYWLVVGLCHLPIFFLLIAKKVPMAFIAFLGPLGEACLFRYWIWQFLKKMGGNVFLCQQYKRGLYPSSLDFAFVGGLLPTFLACMTSETRQNLNHSPKTFGMCKNKPRLSMPQFGDEKTLYWLNPCFAMTIFIGWYTIYFLQRTTLRWYNTSHLFVNISMPSHLQSCWTKWHCPRLDTWDSTVEVWHDEACSLNVHWSTRK